MKPITSNGTVVGIVNGESFVIDLEPSRDFRRDPPGVPIVKAALLEAEQIGAVYVAIRWEKGPWYVCLIALALRVGESVRPRGEMIVVALRHFGSTKREAHGLATLEAQTETPLDEQRTR